MASKLFDYTFELLIGCNFWYKKENKNELKIEI